MADLIFPSANDIGGGRLISEVNFAKVMAALTDGNFVVDGFTFPSSNGTLTLATSTGIALIDGRFIEVNTPNSITVAASSTLYLFLEITVDGLNNATAYQYITSPLITPPNARSVLLAKLITGISSITNIYDQRKIGNMSMESYTPQPTTIVTIPANVATTTTVLDVTERGQLISIGLQSSGVQAAQLKITVDNNTPSILPVVVGGTFSTEWSNVTIGSPSMRLFGSFYRTSLKLEWVVTSAGSSGNATIYVARSKVNN